MCKTSQIVEMLEHFRKKHDDLNKTLYEAGEGHRRKEFKQIEVSDIVAYCLEREGVPKVL